MNYSEFKQKHDEFIVKQKEELLENVLQTFNNFLENIVKLDLFNKHGGYYINFVPYELAGMFIDATSKLGFDMIDCGTIDDAYDTEAKLYFVVK